MSKERTLANIAQTAYWDTESENKNTFDRVANAVEKAVLARLKKSEAEPVAGQELTIGQAAKIAEDNGSTDILEYFNDDLSRFVPCGYSNCIYLGSIYRVALKKVKKLNDPDDPITWEKGVAIFRRDAEDAAWILDVFGGYSLGSTYPYHSNRGAHKYAKLATPEQVAAWKLINGDV